jgi:hypothetical protein
MTETTEVATGTEFRHAYRRDADGDAALCRVVDVRDGMIWYREVLPGGKLAAYIWFVHRDKAERIMEGR